MEKRLVGVVVAFLGCVVVIDGFIRLNSLSSQFWQLVGSPDTTAYAEISLGTFAAIGGLLAALTQKYQA